MFCCMSLLSRVSELQAVCSLHKYLKLRSGHAGLRLDWPWDLAEHVRDALGLLHAIYDMQETQRIYTSYIA